MKPLVSLLLVSVWSIVQGAGCAPPSARAAVSDDIRELIESARGAPLPLCACAAGAIHNHWGWIEPPVTVLGRTVSERPRDRHRLSDEDVRYLLSSLDIPDPCVRELAVRLVADEEREEVVSGLLQRLTSADSSLRMTAAFGLGIGAPRRAIEPLIRATRDQAVGVRANAVWALGKSEDPRAVSPAINLLADRSPVVREAAAGTIGHLEAKSAAPNLSRLLREDRVPGVRRTAAWAIAQIDGEDATQELCTVLQKDPDATVREMCAWAIGNLDRGQTANGALLGAAKRDEDPEVRETAVWSIGQHGDESMGRGLGEVLEADRSAEVKSTAAWALGQLSLSSAPKGLITALADHDRDVRLAAAWALGEIQDQAALPALRTAMAHETDKRARKAELRALIHCGEPAERLSELLQS